ncbi:MAG: 3-isopropylmalate dehydrogenase [Thermomicrobiales bacterium]|nr:3-isopropylmalate dehydrogenase [Thermomicrobiales bacterium]
MSSASIVVFAGDGVGPEVMTEARRTLEAVGTTFGHTFDLDDRLIGGAAIDVYGIPIRTEDIAAADAADAVLLGAVGGPKWDNPNADVRPEQGLLSIRKALGLYANLRPVSVVPALAAASPLKPEIVNGVDFIVVRELTGGIYFGEPRFRAEEPTGWKAVDTLVYHEFEIERVLRLAFEIAQGRRKLVTSVDKANVLESSRLWRSVATRVAGDYPDVTLEHALVDSMAMHLITRPARFDVIVTENMFGDILTDEASVLAGSIGLLPSASLGAPRPNKDGRRLGLYEPIHGSAPDIAGQGKANPNGTILSVAQMLRTSLGLDAEAAAVEAAVSATIDAGIRTGDIGGTATTSEVGADVAARIAQ